MRTLKVDRADVEVNIELVTLERSWWNPSPVQERVPGRRTIRAKLYLPKRTVLVAGEKFHASTPHGRLVGCLVIHAIKGYWPIVDVECDDFIPKAKRSTKSAKVAA